MAYKNKTDQIKYDREYYIKNRDKKLKQKRILYLKNREKILKDNKEKRKEYIKLHPIIRKTEEEKKVVSNIWKIKNRDKYNAYMKEWNRKNRKRLLPLRREYYRTRLSIKVQYNRLKAAAKSNNRNYNVDISIKEFENIVNKPCIYCGESEKRRGVDRIDNTIGYTIENSAPCCKICNRMKLIMSVSEFFDHIKKIYLHNK